ncbi:MAG: NAD(P)-dependent alcohol dehydrogenase [Bacteroidota bacterium]
MKTIILTQYGSPDVLKVREQEKPVPKDNELLIKLEASSVNYGDLLARNFKAVSPSEFNMPLIFWFFAKFYFGIRKPRIKILGSEFSGVVESVGKDVKKFKPGDEVFGYLGQAMGAYAEYFRISEKGVVALKPSSLSFEEAAVLPYGAIMALDLLERAGLHDGQKVLIIGASGSIGSAAVQIAKHYGADVTGICGSQRTDFVKSLGAGKIIDYTKEEFTRRDDQYDLILDVLGKSSFKQVKPSLKEKGIYMRVSFKFIHLLQMMKTSIGGKKRVICALAPGSVDDLNTVKKLIEEGRIKAIVDRKFPFEQTAEANRYIESGKKKGHVAIGR